MDEEKVLQRFALYGGLTAEQAESYRPVVQDAVAQLLDAKNGRAGGEQLLEAAAAALANWRVRLMQAEDDFAAGNVRFAGGKATQGAQALWREALRAAAPWLQDRDFSFRGVG